MLKDPLKKLIDSYKNEEIKFHDLISNLNNQIDIKSISIESFLELVSLENLNNNDSDLYYLTDKMIDNNIMINIKSEERKNILNTFVDNYSLITICNTLGNMGNIFIDKCIEADDSFYVRHKKEIIDLSEQYNLFYITNPSWMKDVLNEIVNNQEVAEIKIQNSIIDLEQIASTNILKSIINWFHLLEQNNVYMNDFFNERNLYELTSFGISGYDSDEGSENLTAYTNFLLDSLNKNQITLENTFKYANSDPDAILKLTSPCLFEKLVPYMLKVEYPFCEKIVSATKGEKMHNFEVLLMAKTENDKYVLADKLGNTQNNKMNIKRI
jgi:hypothetical protein